MMKLAINVDLLGGLLAGALCFCIGPYDSVLTTDDNSTVFIPMRIIERSRGQRCIDYVLSVVNCCLDLSNTSNKNATHHIFKDINHWIVLFATLLSQITVIEDVLGAGEIGKEGKINEGCQVPALPYL